MQNGDWVVMPSKHKPAIHIGKIVGAYHFAPEDDDPYYHRRPVEWFAPDIPRSNFDQDLLYSFGAFLTVCQIKRNDAEHRIKQMHANGWKSTGSQQVLTSNQGAEDDEAEVGDALSDLEQVARDQIAKLIISKFKGRGLESLVEAILKVQDFTTFRSNEGADKGVDILAAPGAMGFGSPRICVQVKSSETALDRATMDQLIGTMQNVHAEQGLLVSWGGFKSSVTKEEAAQFFRVRLWDQDDLIDKILLHYDELDEDLRAAIPLKRIWTVASSDSEE